MNPYISITINKPLHDNYCAISNKIVQQAKRENKWLKITIPQGTGVISPSLWEGTGKIIEKKFRYDTPMRFIANYVPLNHAKKFI